VEGEDFAARPSLCAAAEAVDLCLRDCGCTLLESEFALVVGAAADASDCTGLVEADEDEELESEPGCAARAVDCGVFEDEVDAARYRLRADNMSTMLLSAESAVNLPSSASKIFCAKAAPAPLAEEDELFEAAEDDDGKAVDEEDELASSSGFTSADELEDELLEAAEDDDGKAVEPVSSSGPAGFAEEDELFETAEDDDGKAVDEEDELALSSGFASADELDRMSLCIGEGV